MKTLIDELESAALGFHVTGDFTRCQKVKALLIEATENLDQNEKDALRYRLLRGMFWNKSPLAVVTYPKQNVKLGAVCPSGDQLDSLLDILLDVK